MTQCISGVVDHCMVQIGPTPDDVQSVCCNHTYDFSTLYEFIPTDTANHQCCFIAVRNTTNRACGGLERADGLYCGYGCRICDDHLLDQMVDYLDGERWLRAEQRQFQRYWDARGLISDLRSDRPYHPIPGAIVYERGTCWENGGRECFQADACTCFGANTPEYPGQASSTPDLTTEWNCPGQDAGVPVSGLLPDPFFRTGYRWPPDTMAGALGGNYQGMERLYCRRFQDARLPFDAGGGHGFTRVLISPTKSGGLSGFAEPVFDPVMMSSNVCNSDRMVACTARMGTQSPCIGHSAWDEYKAGWQGGGDPDPAHAFYNSDEPSRNRFNYLLIDGDNTAHIRGAENSEGLSGRTAAWKTGVLDTIKTGTFQYRKPDGTAGLLTFDRLDYMHPLGETNAMLGVYRREWDASQRGPIERDVGEVAGIAVPGSTGTGRLRMSGCVFDYRTFLTHVKIECRLILPQVKEWAGDYYIEPLVRFHIVAVVGMAVFNLRRSQGSDEPAGPCQIRTYADRHLLNLVFCRRPEPEWPQVCFTEAIGERGPFDEPPEPPEPPTPPAPLEWPESLMFFDAENKQFLPDRLIEWRGMLGGHSNPSSEDQRIILPRLLRDSCDWVANRVNDHPTGNGIIVPGWPTHTDSRPGDPQQVYGGHVQLMFEGAQ